VLEQATQLLIEIRTAGATRTRKFLARQLERLKELEESGRASDAQQLRESLELLYGSTPVFQRLKQEAETAP
jgi:Ribonuclease G/E